MAEQPTALQGLDPENNPRDAGMIREAARRWPKRFRAMSEEKRTAIVESLDKARAKGDKLLDASGPDTLREVALGGMLVIGSARAMTGIEALEQRDDHREAELQQAQAQHEDKMRGFVRRLDIMEKGAENPTGGPKVGVVIMVQDARGNQREVTSVREFYASTPAAAPEPTGGAAGSVEVQNGHVRPARGENGQPHGGGGDDLH